jgi:hypothetical protein
LLSWLVLASFSLVGIAAAQTPEAPTPESAAHAAGSSHLRGGWYPWDPYQYREYRHGVSNRLRRGDRTGAGAHHAG